MLNWIWLAFLLVAVLVGGFTGKLPDVTKAAIETAETAVMKIALPLIGIWAIWLGAMRLAERSGLVQWLARALRPLMRFLFPELPADDPAIGAMVLNMAANMLGLGNAATPLGLRAMALLERRNPCPGTATNAMCTFLAINTASIQLIPTTAIGLLAVAGSKDPTAIVVTAFLATVCAAGSGVVSAKFLQRLPWFAPPPVLKSPGPTPLPGPIEMESPAADAPSPKPLTVAGRTILAAWVLCCAGMFLIEAIPQLRSSLLHEPIAAAIANRGFAIRALSAVSVLAIPFLLSFFPLYAALRGVPVYDQFVVGAKEAFGTAQRVIPFLVGMLVAIAMLRAAGVLDRLTDFLRPLFAVIHFPPELMPMVLMRPLSGSATQGIFVELIKSAGPDSLLSRTAATIYGSTETTFYVIAVYFGSVAIRRTRHAVFAGLIADSVAVVASVAICKLFFLP